MLPHSPIFWMQKALDLAEKGRGRTYPNPLAGAVVVKNNKLISGGYHAFFGGPHAEVEALSRAGGRAKGATLYVTLEPCLSFGKTPPCTRLIAEKKIRRVVVAATDPNPVHAGRGIKELRARGLEVVTGILSKEAAVQNEVFFKWVTTGLPFVSLKMAESLDGKIAAVGGASRWITGEKARDFVHKLRATHQAVLVGKNTALKDNPRLNTNIKNAPQPVRVILDPGLEVPLSANVFKAEDKKVIVVTTEGSFKKKFPVYDRRGIGLLAVPLSEGKLDLKDLLVKLAKMGIASVLAEGGGETAAWLLDHHLADKIYFFVAPKIVGGRNATTAVEGAGVRNLGRAIQIKNMKVSNIGGDYLFEGYPAYSGRYPGQARGDIWSSTKPCPTRKVWWRRSKAEPSLDGKEA